MENFHVNMALGVAVCASMFVSVQSTYTGFADVHMMPMRRSDMSVSTYDSTQGTRMYLIGGCSADQVCYDPSDHFSCYCGEITNKTQYYSVDVDRYSTTPADAPRARYRHAAAQVDGVIYLFGGRDIQDAVIKEIDAYTIETNTWSTPCTWADATSDNTAFVDNDQIFLTAGWTETYSSNNVTVLFDPATCSYTTRAPMPNARGDAISISTKSNGKTFHMVVGGFAQDICNGNSIVEQYNTTTDSWTQLQNLKLGRADMALGEIDSHVFAIGGETVNTGCNRSIARTDVERLDVGNLTHPYAGSWVLETEVPANRFRFVGASYQRSIYLFGGQLAWVDNLDGQGNGGFPVSNTTMVYRPNDFTTTTSTSSPTTSPTLDSNSGAVLPVQAFTSLLCTLMCVTLMW
eukprot:m.119652 g.119652  ORF g.119652 m.119652 type:complete len:404 (+) comp28751_c2_seq1:236-1447(+)